MVDTLDEDVKQAAKCSPKWTVLKGHCTWHFFVWHAGVCCKHTCKCPMTFLECQNHWLFHKQWLTLGNAFTHVFQVCWKHVPFKEHVGSMFCGAIWHLVIGSSFGMHGSSRGVRLDDHHPSWRGKNHLMLWSQIVVKNQKYNNQLSLSTYWRLTQNWFTICQQLIDNWLAVAWCESHIQQHRVYTTG